MTRAAEVARPQRLRARYYHPGPARFVAEDLICAAGSPGSLYAYVGNNPNAFTDPRGLLSGSARIRELSFSRFDLTSECGNDRRVRATVVAAGIEGRRTRVRHAASSARRFGLRSFPGITEVLTPRPLLLSLSVLLVFVFGGCGWFEVSEKTFQTHEDAVKADWVGEGRRIPAYIPKSAVEIRVRADAESNETWLFFRAPTEDIRSMVARCEALLPADVKYPRDSPGDWWPKALRPGTREPSSSHKYYRCQDNAVTAVDQGRGEAFEWHFSS